jgi:hypothetical protein
MQLKSLRNASRSPAKAEHFRLKTHEQEGSVNSVKPESTLLHRMSYLLGAAIIGVAFLAAPAEAQFQWAERIASTASAITGGNEAALALDSKDNIYVTGWFDGTDNFGDITLTNQSVGGQDIFVAEYNSSGALQWAQRAGGSPGNFNFGQGVGVDDNGNVYVTGGFNGPADFGSFNLPSDGSQEFYLAKYDNAGAVQWVQQSLGAYGEAYGTGLAVDGAGNSYAVGYDNDGAPLTFGTTTLSFPGSTGAGYTIFLVKYDNTGTVQWAQSIGGSDEVYATKVAVDSNGNVYVRGSFGSKKTSGATMTIGTSTLKVSAGSTKNMFLAKFDNTGALTWVQQPAGGNVDEGGVAVDQAGNVYISGFYGETPLNFGGGISLPSSSSTNAFVAKYSSSGAIQWAREAGGNTKIGFYMDVALDGQGNVYPAGCVSSEAVVAKYDPAGMLQWSYSASGPIGNPVGSIVTKCAVDSAGKCYLVGLYEGTTTFGKVVLHPQEAWNFFIATAGSPAAPLDSVTTSSSPTAGGTTTGSGSYTNGESATVTANPNACYEFVSWTEKSKVVSTDPNYTFTVEAAEALVANFTLKEDAITTAVNPPKSGAVTGKGTYGCDKPVTVKATAAAGYKFICWTVGAPTVSSENPYTFPAAASEELTANFADVSVPTVTITSPTAKEIVDTTVLAISGTAKNVLGVSEVVLTLNGNRVTATSTNNWTNWSAGAILQPGANVLSANALSQAGNPSKTDTVTFENAAGGEAPVALAGLIGEVQMGASAPFEISFGTATFAQFSADTNQGSGVVNYTYTQTGPDTAILATSAFAPPGQGGADGTQLTFTSPANATFTNGDGTTGTITLAAGLGLDVSSQSGWTITTAEPNSITTTFGDGTFSRTDGASGGYTSMQYGPMAALVVLTNADPNGGVDTNYNLLMFTSRSNGQWFVTYFDGAGDPPSYDSGTFTGTYHASGLDYLAPESLNGMQAIAGPTTITFGQATLGALSTSTNDRTAVFNYTYTRTGAKTATFIINPLPPQYGGGSENTNYLTFQSASKATVLEPGGSTGEVTFSVLPQAGYFAPAALPTVFTYDLTADPANFSGSASFNYHNFAVPSNGKTGTYTYAQFSPTVGMIIVTYTDTADVGLVDYVQLTFSSATGGSHLGDSYDTKNDGEITIGSFKLVK